MADGNANGAASDSADDGSGKPGDSSATPASMAGAVLIMLAIGAGVWWALWPQDLPPAKDPGFADNVFASAPVVFAARLILLSSGVVLAVGGLFVVVSIAKLWTAQRWFTRFGPFEASPEAIGTLAEEVEFWRTHAIEQSEIVSDLEKRLQAANDVLGGLLGGDTEPSE